MQCMRMPRRAVNPNMPWKIFLPGATGAVATVRNGSNFPAIWEINVPMIAAKYAGFNLAPEDEVERRGNARSQYEADLSRSSIPSLTNPRSTPAIARTDC
jgi:hypothetical protein